MAQSKKGAKDKAQQKPAASAAAKTTKSTKAAENKKQETSKQIAMKKKQEQEVVQIAKGTGEMSRGFDEFGEDDLILPYAKLMQPLSPEVQDEEGEFEGVKQGHIINSLTGFNYGNELTFIPLLFRKRRIKWIPRDEGGGMDCASMDARHPDTGEMYSESCSICPHSKWTRGPETDKSGNEIPGTMVNRPPACDLIYVFPALIIDKDVSDSDRLIAITFTRTSFNSGKRLVNIARLSGGDIFSRSYSLTTAKEKNEKGIYFVLEVKPVGQIEQAKYNQAENMYEMLHNISYRIHEEAEAEFVDSDLGVVDGDSGESDDELPF